MKLIKLASILFVFASLSCNQKTPNLSSDTETPKVDFQKETKNLEKLVRNLYQWYEAEGRQAPDFDVVTNGIENKYVHLNVIGHARRLAELKQTRFFSSEFLDNYDRIGWKVDKDLRSGKLEYFVGELPPYGNDANPWCNCQDVYSENYWERIFIRDLRIDNNTAYFTWSWGSGFQYEMMAIFEDGNWKIDYMQGFDYDKFFH